MQTKRFIGENPKVGIRPVIDGRQGGVRESLEEQTMNMAGRVAELITSTLKYTDGTPVQCVIADSTIGRVPEAAACAEKFRKEGVGLTISVTPCWCYGSETIDYDDRMPKAIWGFNGTERPGAVYLAAALAGHNQKGMPAFGIYGHDVQDMDMAGEIPEDVKEKLLRFAKAGLPGESHDVILELKLLADVGLIGFPNVGKSTLLSVVSKARPKIANYHFTTLYPNLGVVYVDEGVSFVMADIPGIIEGAADGAGLGHDFLRHIDRCRLLVHVVDVSGSEGRDPVADFDAINAELAQYSPELATRPQIVVANKTDIMEDEALLEKLCTHVEEAGYPLFALSAASHTGTRELVLKIAEKLSTLPPVTVYEPEYVPRPPKLDTSAPLNITVDDNTYIVEGPWLERLMANVNFSDYESRMYFDKMLRESGLFARLEEMGIQDGDIVSLYNLEFEYQH